MAAPIQLHDKAFRHERGGSSALRSRFIRALNLFPEEVEDADDQSGVETPRPSIARSNFEDREDDPFARHELESATCQEMLTMDGIDLPEFESFDELPSTSVIGEESAAVSHEFSDDPDQLWFDETVTTMFMEDADKPKIETAVVQPRMETKAWPLGAIAKGIDPVYMGFVEEDENAETEIETAAQLEIGEEKPLAPTPDTFLITAKDEILVESASEAATVPIKPRPSDDVPAPAQDLPFAAMLGASPADESGKRGFGVKLAPGWKPLRGQKVNPPAKAIAASSGANVDRDAAFDANQELVEATLRIPRQDSILDGFGEFLEEQVILSAAIDGPDFKALAASFDNRDADSNISDTDQQSTSLPMSLGKKSDDVVTNPPSATAPSVKTEWISCPPMVGEPSKPGAAWFADGPTGETQQAADREFVVADSDSNSASTAIEAAEGFADDFGAADEPSRCSAITWENADQADSTTEPSKDTLELSTPAVASDALPKSAQPISAPSLVADDQPRGFSASLLYGAEPAGSFFDDLEGRVAPGNEELGKSVAVAAEQSEPVVLSPVNDIPVSALGYSHSRTNPALIKHGVICPSCGVNLQIQARYLNIEGKCPGCSEMIVARQRGVIEPVAQLATGRFPRFDHQPDFEPSDVPGGTVLSEGAVDGVATPKYGAPRMQVEVPTTPASDPFSNPNHALKKVREAAAGGVWGPTSGKGLS